MAPRFLGAIIRAGMWFVDRDLATGAPVWSSDDDDRARFDLPDAQREANALMREGCDVAIVCERFPSLGL